MQCIKTPPDKTTTPTGAPDGVTEMPTLGLFASGDVEHLPSAVVAAGWASHMTWNCGAALGASLQHGSAPAVSTLAKALAALGLSAFWIGHVRRMLFQLIEDVPDSALRAGQLINVFSVVAFKAALRRTVARVNVAIFAARVVRKGE